MSKSSPESPRCAACGGHGHFAERDLKTDLRTWYCLRHLPADYGLPAESMARLMAMGAEPSFEDRFVEAYIKTKRAAEPALARRLLLGAGG